MNRVNRYAMSPTCKNATQKQHELLQILHRLYRFSTDSLQPLQILYGSMASTTRAASKQAADNLSGRAAVNKLRRPLRLYSLYGSTASADSLRPLQILYSLYRFSTASTDSLPGSMAFTARKASKQAADDLSSTAAVNKLRRPLWLYSLYSSTALPASRNSEQASSR